MKTAAELKEIAQFIAEYATRLMGSGVHTSRVVRNSKRLGEALGVRVIVSAFQRVVTFSVCDDESGEIYSEVADIPPLPISFELNAELSALSWEAFDRRLPLAEIRARYADIIARPRLDPIFTLILVGFANASFCRLFGGDWFAVSIVFTATLLGFFLRQRMQARGFNHYVIFIASSFAVFSVVQALLLALCFSVAVGPCDGDPALLRLFGLLMLLCFGVDAVLLLAVGRFRGKVRDDARAADLGGELDRYLADYQDTVDMAQRSARLRHDLRNQVQVVNALAERGELQLAEQHIDAMLKELDGR